MIDGELAVVHRPAVSAELGVSRAAEREVDPVRLAADRDTPNDVARHDSPSHVDEAARENEIALEQHDAVDRYLSPHARREPIPVGQVNDVDVDGSFPPSAERSSIPATVEIALELDAIVDDDQQIDVRVVGLFTARPGAERGDRQQVGAEAGGRAFAPPRTHPRQAQSSPSAPPACERSTR